MFRNGTHILRNLIQESTEHEAYRARDVLREPLAAGGAGGWEGKREAEAQAEDGLKSQPQPRMLLLMLQVAFGLCLCVRSRGRDGWVICVRVPECEHVDVDVDLCTKHSRYGKRDLHLLQQPSQSQNPCRNQVESGHDVRERAGDHV